MRRDSINLRRTVLAIWLGTDLFLHEMKHQHWRGLHAILGWKAAPVLAFLLNCVTTLSHHPIDNEIE